MKKWILGILLILGWVGAVQAGKLEFVRVDPGDTLSALFREETARACELNLELGRIKSKNCDQIRPGEELQRPAKLPAKQAKAARPQRSEPACITIGAAPFNPEHKLERMLQGIDLLTKLTPEQKELAKQKFARGEMATENELVGQQIFKEMLYQSTQVKQGVKHVYGKPICSSEQGGQPEVIGSQ